jgi:hypothetical protein
MPGPDDEIRNDSVQVVDRHRIDMLHLAERSVTANDQVFSSHFNRACRSWKPARWYLTAKVQNGEGDG